MKVLTGMTGARKAAILALSLGEEGAKEMMTCLEDADVERLAREIATLDTVEPEDREQVLTEFHQKMDEGVSERGGSEAVRRLLDQSLAPDAAKEMYDRVTKSVKTTAGFTSLTQSDPNQLAKFVLNE